MSKIYFIDEVEAIKYYFNTNNIFPINMREYEKLLENNIPIVKTKKGNHYYKVIKENSFENNS